MDVQQAFERTGRIERGRRVAGNDLQVAAGVLLVRTLVQRDINWLGEIWVFVRHQGDARNGIQPKKRIGAQLERRTQVQLKE
jgi:hypothetical protein